MASQRKIDNQKDYRSRVIEATRDFLGAQRGDGETKRRNGKKEPKAPLFRENLGKLRASDANH